MLNRCVFLVVIFLCLRHDASPGHRRDASRTTTWRSLSEHRGITQCVFPIVIFLCLCRDASPDTVATRPGPRARDAFACTDVREDASAGNRCRVL